MMITAGLEQVSCLPCSVCICACVSSGHKYNVMYMYQYVCVCMCTIMIIKHGCESMHRFFLSQSDNAVVEISLKLSKVYTNQKKCVNYHDNIYILLLSLSIFPCHRYDLASTGFHWCVTTARDNLKENGTENR